MKGLAERMSGQVSVLRAFNKIRRKKMLECNIEANPRGYGKQWEIRFGTTNAPLQGSFACYRQSSFVTYCINLDGRDFWFDRYDLAMAALLNETLLSFRNAERKKENFLS